MGNQKNVLAVTAVIILVLMLAFALYRSIPLRVNSDDIIPKPTIAATPIADNKVNEYTSSKAYLSLKFTKPMYVVEQKVSETSGWVYVSINPINLNDPKFYGLSINYETPAIEGKGGACEPGNYHANSVLGQTLNMCETQKRMWLAYLTNKSAQTEYAFFIEAKGTTEYALYRLILTEGLTFVNK